MGITDGEGGMMMRWIRTSPKVAGSVDMVKTAVITGTTIDPGWGIMKVSPVVVVGGIAGGNVLDPSPRRIR